jgi:hypothetical protein
MFDIRMPQIEGGSGSDVVVWTCVVLEVGLTESRIFVCNELHLGEWY